MNLHTTPSPFPTPVPLATARTVVASLEPVSRIVNRGGVLPALEVTETDRLEVGETGSQHGEGESGGVETESVLCLHQTIGRSAGSEMSGCLAASQQPSGGFPHLVIDRLLAGMNPASAPPPLLSLAGGNRLSPSAGCRQHPAGQTEPWTVGAVHPGRLDAGDPVSGYRGRRDDLRVGGLRR